MVQLSWAWNFIHVSPVIVGHTHILPMLSWFRSPTCLVEAPFFQQDPRKNTSRVHVTFPRGRQQIKKEKGEHIATQRDQLLPKAVVYVNFLGISFSWQLFLMRPLSLGTSDICFWTQFSLGICHWWPLYLRFCQFSDATAFFQFQSSLWHILVSATLSCNSFPWEKLFTGSQHANKAARSSTSKTNLARIPSQKTRQPRTQKHGCLMIHDRTATSRGYPKKTQGTTSLLSSFLSFLHSSTLLVLFSFLPSSLIFSAFSLLYLLHSFLAFTSLSTVFTLLFRLLHSFHFSLHFSTVFFSFFMTTS